VSLLSLQFILLSCVTVLLMWTARGPVRLWGFLLASGYFAFSYLGWRGMAFTLLFCAGGFLCAEVVRRRPRLLWLAVTGLTAVFVYARSYTFLELVLPERLITTLFVTAGLSFLFFKIVHVVVDTAAGTIRELPLLRYYAYCLNFTAFLLGPIQRYQDFDRQWKGEVEALPATFDAHLDAFNRVLRGMVKKYVVAEYLVTFALQADAPVQTMAAPELLLATYMFYLFLYFDFSGYCDIVIGIGALMGVRPPENFNLPFFSGNVSQYWLRVHESLTRWLTDYVFNPSYAAGLRSRALGDHPLAAMLVAVVITMLVTGMWHGTTFAFVLFGLVHALYMAVFRTYEHLVVRWRGRKGLKALRANRAWSVASVLVTFHFTASAYLFFVLDTDQLLLLLGRLR